MKPHGLLVAALMLVPALGWADEFSEFRIPDHSWRSGAGQFNASASRSRSANETFLNSDRNANGQLQAGIVFGRDADRFSRLFTASIAGGLAGSRGEASGYSGATQNEFRSGDGARSITLGAAQRSYRGASAWAVGASVNARADFSQYWQRYDRRMNAPLGWLSRDFRSDDRYTYQGSAGLTLGRGRVRDATVVMDVHVMEERLLAAGTIAGPLEPATRARLAEVLLAGQEIGAAHERPGRYQWREIERVLREGGALGPAGLDAYAVLRARESYATQRLSRMRGEYVGLRVDGRHWQELERVQQQYAEKYFQGDSLVFQYQDDLGQNRSAAYDDVFVGVEGEFHRPVGWRWQFDASGSASVPVSTEDHGLSTATRLSADWIVADRWRAGASFASERAYLRHGDALVTYVRDRWYTDIGVFASYFLEDHLALTAQMSSRQSRYNGPYPYYSQAHQVTIGLRYLFLGRFDAPGLMEPMRPLP